MTRRNLLAVFLVALSAFSLTTTARSASPFTATSWGRRYWLPVGKPDEIAVLGPPPSAPRKTAILVYQGAVNTLTVPGTAGADFAAALVENGWTVAAINCPSHAGVDLYPGEPTQLNGWPWRYANGFTLWDLGYDVRIPLGLDILVGEGYTDPNKVAGVGISRGGIPIFRSATMDPRLRVVVGLNPATELLSMNPWFNNHPQPEACAAEDVRRFAPQLVNHSILLTAVPNDTIVSTDAVVRFYDELRAAGLAATPGLEPDHTLIKVGGGGSPGHRVLPINYKMIVGWMDSRVE